MPPAPLRYVRTMEKQGGGPVVVSVQAGDDPGEAARLLGLATERPVLVVVGGAGGLDEASLAALVPCAEALVRAAAAAGAALVDGGTDAGVMRLLGEAHAAAGSRSPLVGVAVEALVRPGEEAVGAAAALEPNHTHVVLVPGSTWGDEVPWLAWFAGAVAAGRPSVTVLVNGGEISLADVAASVDAGRKALAVAGTGRAADALAAALAGTSSAAPQVEALARSGLVEAVSLGEDALPSLEEKVKAILGSRTDGQ